MIPKNIERRIRQHIQAKTHNFFAIVQPGFENTALGEISRIGVELPGTAVIEGGIEFSTGIKNVWEINYLSRCITRILMRIVVFKALFFEKFREHIATVPWELYLKPGCLPELTIKCRHSKLYHTGRLQQECRAGILKRMESAYPGITQDKSLNSQTVYVRFKNDICTVSIDTTGDPLYKRGLRKHITKAPIRETLASCILYEADIEKFDTVLDPMCGSGIIPLEAASILKKIPAGIVRNFSFENWPGHREKAFNYFKKNVTEKNKTSTHQFNIFASDIDEKAVEITRYNSESSGLGGEINISRTDFFSLTRNDFPEGRLLIASNPPYGGRIVVDNIIELYREIGSKLHKDFSGSYFAIIVPGSKAEKALGISPLKRIQFINGGKKVALLTGIC